MKTQEYIEAFNEGVLPISDVQPFIEQLLLERDEATVANEDFEQIKLSTFGGLNYNEDFEQIKLSTFGGLNYKDVFEQEEFYNGHGQLEVLKMTLEDAFGLIEQLELHAYETPNKLCDIFTLKLYKETNGKYSGTIYQETSDPIMWLNIEDVVINEY